MSQRIRVGAFLLVTLGILGVFVFMVGSLESRFKSTYEVKAEFQNVAGLTEGAPVRVGGINRGTVHHIQLPNRPDGKVSVQLSLSKDTLNVVKQDSVASIKSEGLLGDKIVEVSFGSPEAGKLKGGETIATQPPLDISDLVAKTNQLLDGAHQALQGIQGVTENVDQITAKVNQGKGTVGALINNPSMYREATAGATAMREDAEALKHNFLLRGYFKNRGYEDSADLKKYAITELPPGPPQKVFAFEANNIFDKPESAKLKNQKSFNDSGKYLESQPSGTVVIASFAAMKGDSDKDRELSLARAFVVRDYLVKNFKLDGDHIKTIALAKRENTRDRIEVRVFPKAQEDKTAK